MLELHFQSEHKLDSERKDRLASHLGLDPRQVAVWFQNRRARWKSKKLEEEYLRLKTEHDCTLSEKCLLTTEVSSCSPNPMLEINRFSKLIKNFQLLKLKQRLSETEKEKQKLLQQSNSPSSSISAGVTEPPFVAEFGLDTMFCVTQNNYDYDAHGFDSWPNLYDMQLY